jgi:hypothetical protein
MRLQLHDQHKAKNGQETFYTRLNACKMVCEGGCTFQLHQQPAATSALCKRAAQGPGQETRRV